MLKLKFTAFYKKVYNYLTVKCSTTLKRLGNTEIRSRVESYYLDTQNSKQNSQTKFIKSIFSYEMLQASSEVALLANVPTFRFQEPYSQNNLSNFLDFYVT